MRRWQGQELQWAEGEEAETIGKSKDLTTCTLLLPHFSVQGQNWIHHTPV